MNNINISLWNANGLQATSVSEILNYCEPNTLLFITETWLLPPTALRTDWKQFHLYGIPVQGNYRGQMGITALVHPSFPYPVTSIPMPNKFTLALKVGNLRAVCMYLPPSIADEEAIVALDTIPLLPDTIICGDLNARLGDITGDYDVNARGRALKEWIQDRRLHVLNGTLAHGQPTFLSYRRGQEISSIIDLFLTNFPPVSATLKIRQELSLGSDHKLMTLSFHHDMAQGPSDTDTTDRRLWNINRLRREKPRDRYIQSFEAHSHILADKLNQLCSSPPNARPDIDRLSAELNEIIYNSLDGSVGRLQPRSKDCKMFWTPNVQQAADQREQCYRKWRRARGLNKALWWQRHQEAQAHFRTEIQAAKRRAWRNFCQSLEKDLTKTASKIKHLRRRRQKQCTFTHDDGTAAAAAAMRNHLASIYDGRLSLSGRHPSTDTPGLLAIEEVSPFTSSAIEVTIRQLPNRKAPGADHIKAEMLKPITAPLSKILQHFFTVCWQWSYTPTAWRHAQVCPIFKKGDHTDAANYRPISLTSVFRKLLEMCLAPALANASPPIDVAQGGFRHRRSALDQVVCLQDLITQYFRLRHHYPVMAFLDIKAAYDTVDRQVIWDELTRADAPRSLVMLLQNMFNEVTVSVLLANHISTSFSPKTGVLQGSVLSPSLYSIYINRLPALLRTAATPSTTRLADNTPINSLLFADDVAIFGTASEVQQMLTIAERHSLDLGYRWSPTKCAILNPPIRSAYKLYGTPIPTVDQFTYLGVPIIKNGINTSALIKLREQSAILAMSTLHALGASRSGFSLLLSARLYAQFIRPKFEYGLAISILKKTDLASLERLQDRCFRIIMGGHRTSSMAALRYMLNIPPMIHRFNILTTQFCIRARFLPDDCLLTLLSDAIPNNRLQTLRRNRLYTSLPSPLPSNLRSFFTADLQHMLDAIRPTHVLLTACRPIIGIDPLLYLPATKTERSRMVRWRTNWLPGKPKPCLCNMDHTSRRHFRECRLISSELWQALPPHPDNQHPLDFALSSLPLSPKTACPYWTAILKLLRRIDELCYPEVQFPAEEEAGSLWRHPPV